MVLSRFTMLAVLVVVFPSALAVDPTCIDSSCDTQDSQALLQSKVALHTYAHSNAEQEQAAMATSEEAGGNTDGEVGNVQEKEGDVEDQEHGEVLDQEQEDGEQEQKDVEVGEYFQKAHGPFFYRNGGPCRVGDYIQSKSQCLNAMRNLRVKGSARRGLQVVSREYPTGCSLMYGWKMVWNTDASKWFEKNYAHGRRIKTKQWICQKGAKAAAAKAKRAKKAKKAAVCPQEYPYAYRPSRGFDYCCSSADDNTGKPGVNSQADRSKRADSCKGHKFKKCTDPPCADYQYQAPRQYNIFGAGQFRECSLALRVYDAASDNPGEDFQTSVQKCGDACADQRQSTNNVAWETFGTADSFSVTNDEMPTQMGRCYCTKRSTCPAAGGVKYKMYTTYDIVKASALLQTLTTETMDTSESQAEVEAIETTDAIEVVEEGQAEKEEEAPEIMDATEEAEEKKMDDTQASHPE